VDLLGFGKPPALSETPSFSFTLTPGSFYGGFFPGGPPVFAICSLHHGSFGDFDPYKDKLLFGSFFVPLLDKKLIETFGVGFSL